MSDLIEKLAVLKKTLEQKSADEKKLKIESHRKLFDETVSLFKADQDLIDMFAIMVSVYSHTIYEFPNDENVVTEILVDGNKVKMSIFDDCKDEFFNKHRKSNSLISAEITYGEVSPLKFDDKGNPIEVELRDIENKVIVVDDSGDKKSFVNNNAAIEFLFKKMKERISDYLEEDEASDVLTISEIPGRSYNLTIVDPEKYGFESDEIGNEIITSTFDGGLKLSR